MVRDLAPQEGHPLTITERVAVATFIAGYTDPTRRSSATDLRIFAGCHDHGISR